MRKTGSAVNGLSWLFAVRYVVMAISADVEFERAAHTPESADDRRNLDMLELDAGTDTVPSFRPFRVRVGCDRGLINSLFHPPTSIDARRPQPFHWRLRLSHAVKIPG